VTGVQTCALPIVMRGPQGSAHRRIRLGIFAMHSGQHRRQRRLMQPPFLKPAVAGYADTMARLIDEVIDRWQPGEAVDMYREMRKLSNWVAAHILFGNEDFAASLRLGEMIEEWLILDARARSTYFWVNAPGTAYHRLLRQAAALEQAMKEAIERNRRTKTPGSDVLSNLIRVFDSGETRMTEADLIAHGVILYAASFETTANVLAWTLFLIAEHPQVATDLHDEVMAGFGGSGAWPPDGAELDALPLLDGVVHESMRLMPPVAYTFRSPLQDVGLGPLALHVGDSVLLSHYITHRDPAVFPNPNRFEPSRWFTARPDPYQYIPFSAGPRLCLGYSFALLELKLTVARIVQRFRLGVVPGSQIDGVIQLTLRPRLGIPMIVHPQDRAFAAAPVTGNIHRMVDDLAR
jgi:cytochrome P450